MSYSYEYPHPAVTVDIIVIASDRDTKKVLLIKRKNYPFEGKWALPGGFVDKNENLLTASKRELEEETGLSNIELKQLHAFGEPGRDPRGWNISICHYGMVNINDVNVVANDDASEAQWFDVNNLPDFALDHQDILTMGIENLVR